MRALLIILTFTLIACTTVVNKTFDPIGGSKSDGTLLMALQYNGNEEAHWDWGEASHIASTRCRAWGYTAASRFNNGNARCVYPTRYGCLTYQWTVQYQCTN